MTGVDGPPPVKPPSALGMSPCHGGWADEHASGEEDGLCLGTSHCALRRRWSSSPVPHGAPERGCSMAADAFLGSSAGTHGATAPNAVVQGRGAIPGAYFPASGRRPPPPPPNAFVGALVGVILSDFRTREVWRYRFCGSLGGCGFGVMLGMVL